MTTNNDERTFESALGLFAKWPQPGMVKSRLAADTSPEWAAKAARAFLTDLVERFRHLPVHRLLVYSPMQSHSLFATLLQNRFDLTPQCTGDLGKRMQHFLKGQFDFGIKRVVLIGMDSPTLPLEFVQQAFELLEDADVVLGPATDGGYYLIGCRKYVPELFENIEWSGAQVFYETIQRIEEQRLSLRLLPPWYDVDTIEDWWMLRGHVRAMQLAGCGMIMDETDKVMPSD